MDDIRYMRRALELAALGRGSVSPNPMVGCVIVHDEKIIGEGYHQQYGQPHAEVNAIAAVSDPNLLSESTAYVTLEPCAHHGKRPPCADLLVEKKLKNVVIACRDPFPEVDGKGVEKLEKAGIRVTVGVLETEARDLNVRFFTAVEKNRPYVILKWAQTADRFVARSNYDSKWISLPESRQLVHKWRTEEDAILVGKNTAKYDDPALTARDWKGKNPLRVLLDTNLEIPMGHKIFNSAAPTLIFNSVKDEESHHLLWIKADQNNPLTILQKLQERKIQSVIIEGGSHVLNSFISENCWDEARVFTSNQKFENGIPAPEIQGEVISKTMVGSDQLTNYKNTHG